MGGRERRETRKHLGFRLGQLGGMVVSFPEIEETEGRAGFVGDDGFGCVELKTHMEMLAQPALFGG